MNFYEKISKCYLFVKILMKIKENFYDKLKEIFMENSYKNQHYFMK
jgi:hypothetical protein